MTERASQHQKISTSGALSPTEIAERSFAVARKGLSPTEVRSFLRRVADSLGAAQQREQDLLADMERLEAKLAEPVKLDERELLDALGEETAKVLRSAQDAADAIRVKADERALRIVREAQEEGQRLRETTERLVAEQRQNAEDVASEIRETADRNARESAASASASAEEMKAQAEREAEATTEEARATGREMVAEARNVRERILTDLTKRRNDLEAQIDALKSERERLVEAHRVVQRAVAEAGEALTGATGSEADAAAHTEIPDLPDFIDSTGSTPTPEADSSPASERDEETPGANGSGADSNGTQHKKGVRAYVRGALGYEKSGADREETVADKDVGDKDVGEKDVGEKDDAADAIFAKLRRSAPDDSTEAAESSSATGEPDTAIDVSDDSSNDDATDPADDSNEPAGVPAVDDDAASVALRDREESLAPQRAELAKSLKRQLREDQNELLDALRKKRGKLTSEKLLPSETDARKAWVNVVSEPATAAYTAGGSDMVLPDELLADLAGRVVLAQREILATTIDDDTADADEIVESIRARYREWKSSSVDQWVDDILVTAHAQGAYDAVDDGALLRWVVDPDGTCGPDCEDNTLEPTRAGEPFPTGQIHPPAYPGCRCVAVPLDDATAEALGIATSAAS